MFKIKSTGKNEHYGKAGEMIILADNHLVQAIQEKWVEGTPIDIGNYGHEETIRIREVPIMPEKPIYIMNELKMQTRAMGRILKELKFIEAKRVKLMKLMKEMKHGK